MQHKLIIIFLHYVFLDSSGNFAKFTVIWFAAKVVNTKVIDKLCIKLLSKFGGIWPSSLGATVIQSLITVLLALCLVGPDYVVL